MSQDRVYNFSAGPSMLPLPVLEKAASELANYRGTGMSVMEMSHRSKAYQEIFSETKTALRETLSVPETHDILFMQGGKADYIDSGNFAHNALVEARKYGEVVVAGSSREDQYAYIPDYTLSPDAKYVHIIQK